MRRALPCRAVDTRSGAQGSGLFSRFPLERRKPYNSLNQNGEPRALIRIPGAEPVDVQVVHPPPFMAIDHVLVDPRMRADAVSVHTIPDTDHRAVVATLIVPKLRP
ncbi:MAG TPA: hypothetical protein VFG42_07590 [Baekduia sp.]|uniref:endonuclease/exonuclease/phosphatase family protein n=1 Tax=Baekduia sp. TaxID=2600305 RepID=UPI002D791C73|nr:hypothetical protein [Baekduia sp.]HET6506635.1 hypothetical protein [Baekduia sp.]